MIKTAKLMRVECDRKKCKAFFVKEVEFDGYDEVSTDFIKDANFHKVRIKDTSFHLCVECCQIGASMFNKFMEKEEE